MNKLMVSIAFYVAAFVAMVLVFNNESIFLTFVGLMTIFLMMSFAKAFGIEEMYNILGINWLKNKFKNNCVIMDMTNE